MSDDNVTKLAAAAGISEQQLTEDEKNVMRKLQPNEVAVLSKVLSNARDNGIDMSLFKTI